MARALEERGWALHNLGSLPHISVGGATATGTHGSGDGNGVLTTAVRGIRYVGADGEVHEVRRGDPDFDALAVGVGAFGIIVALTLDIHPSYRVRQDIYAGVTWDAALADLAAAHRRRVQRLALHALGPRDDRAVWVKTRLEADDDPVGDTLLDGERVRRRRVARSAAATTSPRSAVCRDRGCCGSRTSGSTASRRSATRSRPSTSCRASTVRRALRAVRALGDSIRPHLVWSEIRTAARDELWLSGAYQQDIVIIHFTWFDHPDEVGAAASGHRGGAARRSARARTGARCTGSTADDDRARASAPRRRAGGVRAPRSRRAGSSNAHLERVGLRERADVSRADCVPA